MFQDSVNGVIAAAILAHLEHGAKSAAAAVRRRAVKRAIAPLHQAGTEIISIAAVKIFQDGVNGIIAATVLAHLEHGARIFAAAICSRAVKAAIAPLHQAGLGTLVISAISEVF